MTMKKMPVPILALGYTDDLALAPPGRMFPFW